MDVRILIIIKIILDDGEQFLTDIYEYLEHDDDLLVISTLNFILNNEKALFLNGRIHHNSGV